jgi:iron complex transport system substrate-binding protein
MKKVIVILLLAAALKVNAQNPLRIVTAGSAITETVCALGDCDKIIGSDKTSLYPAAIQYLPSIGYRNSITAEGILSLKPTLVIAEKDYMSDAVVKQLSLMPVKLLIIERDFSLAGTKRLISQIATVLDREKEAQRLITQLDNDLATARAISKKQSSNTIRAACIYNRGTGNINAAGKNTFAEILFLIGVHNVFESFVGYKPLSAESLIASNPDFLVFPSTGFESAGGMEGILKIPGVSLTTAGKKKQVVYIDATKLTNFGPRLGEAVKELVMLMYPETSAP